MRADYSLIGTARRRSGLRLDRLSDLIPYALETDWPLGAGGFAPLHFRIGIREDQLRQERTGRRTGRTVDAGPVYCPDRLHEYGTPFFIEANLPTESVKSVSPFGRLMIAQDTGSAIAGPARYNESRIHRSLDKDTPFHRAIERFGVITSQPVLGGLHHQYCRI
jgi:hypothetical protein